MTKPQKILTTLLWACTVLAAIALVTGMSLHAKKRAHTNLPITNLTTETAELPPIPVPAFSLTDQRGETVSADSLKGTPFVSAFIFTRCAGPCPMMADKMAELEETTRGRKINIVLFTLDPAHDTPAILNDYAKTHDLTGERCFLLTGTRQQILDIASGMKVGVQDGQNIEDLIHAEYFVLVDSTGMVKGFYHPRHEDDMTRLQSDMAALTK